MIETCGGGRDLLRIVRVRAAITRPAVQTRTRTAMPEMDPVTLYETLDLLPHHLALMSPAGRAVHVNRWLRELLRRTPGGRYLEDALGCYARSIAGREPPPARDGRAEAPAMLEFSTSDGTCLLWGWCLELNRYGLGRLVLMTVQPGRPDLPSDEEIRERWGLTPREIEVARLLAEGRTNADIAAALGNRENTIRHHTEKIFRKLGVRSRAEVGPRLRNPPPKRE